VSIQTIILKRTLITACTVIMLSVAAAAQPNFKLHISSVEIPKIKDKNWLGRPLKNDYIVRWELYTVDAQDTTKITPTKETEISQYRIYLAKGDSTFSNRQAVKDTLVTGSSSAVFSGNKVGKDKYYFRVDGLENDRVIVQSDIAWAVCGIMAQNQVDPNSPEVEKSFFVPLFFPIAELLGAINPKLQNSIYQGSSPLGRLSFSFIWYFVIISVVLLRRYCLPSLKLSAIFPLCNHKKKSSFKSLFDKDSDYEERLAPRFRFVIEAWKRVILKTNAIAHDKATNMADVEKKCYEHFNKYGLDALKTLRDIIKFDPAKDSAALLEVKIGKVFGKKSQYFNIVDEAVDIVTRHKTIKLNWNDIKTDLFDPKSCKLEDYSTVKIFSAGLGNYILNGMDWQNVSSEVDRAIENRATSEIQNMQEHSSIEWLWNFGALAPLLGLFGTVTGISEVFSGIRGLGENTSQLELVKQLSSGIFEALWTTIYGLIAGIILMIIFYILKNKLDWIYNKWQSLFVHVSENL
jgi:hypothetical protein